MNRNLMAVDVAGMQGVGLTKAEAKANAMERLAEAMAGSYVPKILSFQVQIFAVIFRAPNGWGYVLTSHEKCHRGRCMDEGFVSEHDAERSCRVQAAQWMEGRTLDDGMSALEDARDKDSHARYVGFQRAYRFYQAQGMSDQDCHWEACQHEQDFMPGEELPV